MNLIEKAILRLQRLVRKSDDKLEWMPNCSEKTREYYHNGNLHLELRKLTILANEQNRYTYYCSRCGEKFKTTQQRAIHTLNDHGK